MVSEETLLAKLVRMTNKRIGHFIIYYFTPEEKREPWADFARKNDISQSFDDACKWLMQPNVQEAVQAYEKYMKTYNLTMLYESMLKKAMQGDVKAATWVQNFSNSDYFNDDEDEIDDFLDGVKIPALNGKA